MIIHFFMAIIGLGIFLGGMKILATGLQATASQRLKRKIQGRRIHPVVGMLIGLVVTMVIQSSSAATVILVGMAEAGLLSLLQITPMIMGANIGTTATAQLVAFDMIQVALILFPIGGILHCLKGHPIAKLGKPCMGFSMIFIGMELLSQGMLPLQNLLRFREILAAMGEEPILGILMGFFTTAIIQSSSAGVAILQSLGAGGTITVHTAVPIMLGQNIGTCVTAMMAGVGLSKTGKRAAAIHLIFNVVGVLVVLPFIRQLCQFSIALAPDNVVRQIAHSHSFFNIFTTLLFLPFSRWFVKAACWIIRD